MSGSRRHFVILLDVVLKGIFLQRSLILMKSDPSQRLPIDLRRLQPLRDGCIYQRFQRSRNVKPRRQQEKGADDLGIRQRDRLRPCFGKELDPQDRPCGVTNSLSSFSRLFCRSIEPGKCKNPGVGEEFTYSAKEQWIQYCPLLFHHPLRPFRDSGQHYAEKDQTPVVVEWTYVLVG